jgi:hypothetical protein
VVAIDIESDVAACEAGWPTTIRCGLVREASSTAVRTWFGPEGILDGGVTASGRRYIGRRGSRGARWLHGGGGEEWIGDRSGTREAEVWWSV